MAKQKMEDHRFGAITLNAFMTNNLLSNFTTDLENTICFMVPGQTFRNYILEA